MAPKQLEGLPRTSTENIKAWFSSEFNNAEKLQAHLVSVSFELSACCHPAPLQG
jgi:hypothetical protein